MVPAHPLSAVVSHKYGDQQATIRFHEENADLTHYTRLRSSANGVQDWEISSEINRRTSPPVTRVGFIPATYSVSIEDKWFPDLLLLPGGNPCRRSF